MSIVKPYTFQGGTKARANEVNENFDVLYSEVNSNISAINSNSTSISNLEAKKANVNGSTNNVFKVRDPVVSQDAVNKQTLVKRIGNVKNFINGLEIKKDSSTNNNMIIVDSGECYDSTGEYILSITEKTTAQNTSQYPSTRYNVFLQSTNNGTSSEVIINSGELTSDNGLFRKIGFYWTDSSNNIVQAVSYGTDNNCNELSKLIPDYGSGAISVTVPANKEWTVPCSGWIVSTATNTTWKINNEVFGWTGYTSIPYKLETFIPADSSIRPTANYTFNFLPCRSM